MRLPWNKEIQENKLSFEVKYYPDGSSYVVVNEFVEDITFRINNYEDLWILTQLKDIYDHNDKTLSITIPCLIDAQADRRFKYNQSHGLKLVLEHLKRLNFKRIRIFHPHNQEVVEAILPNVMFLDNSEFINLVIYGRNYINLKDTEDLILMSTDAGGFKPLMKLADTLNWKGEVFSASKSRSTEIPGLLHQQINREDFGGKDILIIDDICVYGGTFKGLAKMLRERNVGKLYLAVSHMTIADLSRDPLTDHFDMVFSTNSKGLDYMGLFKNKLNIIKLF